MINKIKELRKSKGYRQEDLAEALNVSRQTIIAIENNKYNPTLELAMKLARYLNTTIEELFELEDEAMKKKLIALIPYIIVLILNPFMLHYFQQKR